MFRTFDASVPPQQPYPGCAGVLGYIGGNTPHVWTPDEWRRFEHLRQAPIWVADLSRSASLQGLLAVDKVTSLGWHPNARYRRIIVLDMETNEAPAFVQAFGTEVYDAGFEAIVYESKVAVPVNPPLAGRWEALWDGKADVPAGCVAHQYIADQPWETGKVDLSMWEWQMLDHFGFGARKG